MNFDNHKLCVATTNGKHRKLSELLETINSDPFFYRRLYDHYGNVTKSYLILMSNNTYHDLESCGYTKQHLGEY